MSRRFMDCNGPQKLDTDLRCSKIQKRGSYDKTAQLQSQVQGRVVVELISGEKGLMQASREYGVKDTVLSRWSPETPADPNLRGSAETCFLKG